MGSEQTRLEPYFRNGLLYLPERTANLLVRAGLDASVGRAAVRGLPLDDAAALAALRAAVTTLLAQVEPGDPVHAALASAETRFMLTGLPAQCDS
ncbi:MAG: hypothetical protein ACUVSX_05690 [Aggregatilineales bacterium]